MEGSSTHLRCSVRIDLCALERNLGKLKYFLPKTGGYIALVSADAFGYGVEAAVVRLMLSGADGFAVTNAEEGVRVREVGGGWRIIVMSSSLAGEEEVYFKNALTPVLASVEEIERFERTAERFGRKIGVHMRLPVTEPAIPSNDDAREMLEKLLSSPRLVLEAFCLPGTGTGAPAEGSDPDTDFLEFAAAKLAKSGRKIFIHHSDVCDIAKFPAYFGTALRAGLVLFGMKPSSNSILNGFDPEHVLAFRSSVSLIKELPAGTSVGYGRTYTLSKPSKIALLSVGYGDGVPREAGGRMHVIIRGHKYPVIGRVSMDQAAIDISGADDIKIGDEAVIVGSNGGESISIEEYSKALSITPAQALTSITKRVARFYKTLY